MDVLQIISAGGDLGTWAVVFVYLKHSNALKELATKIEYLEKYLIN